MINTISTNIIEVFVLPRTSIDVEPHMYRVAHLYLKLFKTISAKNRKITHTWKTIGSLLLNYKILLVPFISSTFGHPRTGIAYFDDFTDNFYT